MAEIIRIPDGNAFLLRVTGQIRTGDYTEIADFSVVTHMGVNFVRRGRIAQTFGLDSLGRIVIENSGNLAQGVYGVELYGYYHGEPWRNYQKNVFQIVNENANSDPGSDNENELTYDVTFDVTFGGDGISAAFVEATVATHNGDQESHPDLREEIDKKVSDVKVGGTSVVEGGVAVIDLSGKQDVIDDLADIRSGAAAGDTAYQKPGTGIPESDMSEAVKAKLAKAETALQEHQDISGKQDVIQDLATIRSGAAAGGTAYQKPGTGIPASDLSSEVQDMIENGGKTKSVSVNGGTPVTPDADGQVDLTIEQANITIGTVTTGAAGSNADVHNSGTGTAPILDFVIPKGDTGATGPQGPMGESVIVGQGDLPLSHVLGQSTEKAMSQKGVTDAIEETKQIITGDFVPDFSITNNHYITYKGAITYASGYSYTSPIQVKKGDIITYIVGSATSGNAKLSLTDEEGTFYNYVDRTTGAEEKTYEVLNDGYVALSGLTSDGFQVKINRGGLQRQVEEMQHEVADVLEEVKGEDVTPAYTIKSNYYISTAGNDTAHNAYSRSNKIAMLKDDVLDFTATVSSSTVAALALTNEAESSFTPVITGTGSQQRTYKAVADCYVVVSYHIAEGLVLEVRRGGIDILEQRVESIENAITPYDEDGMPSHPANPLSHLISCPSRARVFSSYGIIGASWDTGYSDGGTPFYDLGYEWPTLFAKTNGVEVHNYALPGHWLNVWLRDRNDSPVFSGSNLPFDGDTFQPDAYLVCMSSNDVNTNNYSAEIGSASDIDPTTDYTQKSYAYNTPFVEVLAEIIQRCKAKSPDCWVFLTTIHKYTPSQSAWVTRRNEMCQAMRDVAPLFDRCDVIDIFQYGMNWDTLANRKKYCSSDSAGSHPSRLGHIYLADQYNTYLDWWVANHAESLRNIQRRLQ